MNGNGRFDLIWSRIRAVLSFLLGFGILAYETIGDHVDRPWLLAAAVGVMGLPIAQAAEQVLEKFSSDKNPNPEQPATLTLGSTSVPVGGPSEPPSSEDSES